MGAGASRMQGAPGPLVLGQLMLRCREVRGSLEVGAAGARGRRGGVPQLVSLVDDHRCSLVGQGVEVLGWQVLRSLIPFLGY